MEEKCKNCENQQACVSFFMHENSMMHKDADNERLANIAKDQRTINVVQSVIILLIVFIMAMFYTSRTQMWNDTISKQNETIIKLLNERSPAEVADGVHEQPNP
jgi:uncharacterized membrane protein YvbJ